jgi:serine/threonine-protein kinase
MDLDGRPLSWDYLQPLFLQACLGMAGLHRLGVFQADYKPENLLVNQAGNVHITDFDIADVHGDYWVAAGIEPIASLQPDEHFFGTMGHIAPERTRLEEAAMPDERSDTYSLVSTLHTLLSGELPFLGETPGIVAWLKNNQDPPRLTVKGLPPRLPDIVQRGLLRDPDQRIQTPQELRQELSNVLSGKDACRGPAVGLIPPAGHTNLNY